MGTGEETVRFMEENFNMSAIEFIALSAVHSVVQARATLGTKWVSHQYQILIIITITIIVTIIIINDHPRHQVGFLAPPGAPYAMVC